MNWFNKKLIYKVYLQEDKRYGEVVGHWTIIGKYKTTAQCKPTQGQYIPMRIKYWDDFAKCIKCKKTLVRITKMVLHEQDVYLYCSVDKAV